LKVVEDVRLEGLFEVEEKFKEVYTICESKRVLENPFDLLFMVFFKMMTGVMMLILGFD
jgi:hypothetical protein